MTNEDAKNHIKAVSKMAIDNGYTSDIVDACLMAIMALEQESCEDCISREETKNLIHRLTRWCVRSEDGKFNNVGLLYDDVMFGIHCLPRVQPKAEQEPKTGHWECSELFYEGESRGTTIRCNKCGNEFKVSPKVFENLYDNERFCNHCGAKMAKKVER